MCEIIAAAFPAPRPFAEIADFVTKLEVYGLGGFGWGVAWLENDGKVQIHRDTGRYVDQGASDEQLLATRSARFLVHLRRPSRLSTTALPDTQPFGDGERAFCHNGFLARAYEMRPEYADRLEGRADSEVGWVYLQDRLAAGADPEAALAELDRTFGGRVNLGYLGGDGTLAVYTRNGENALWRFGLGDAELASSALHSDDESVFDLVFPAATDRCRLPQASGATVAGPVHDAA
ncbi:MAG TPA: class II glutamine amidotransferase [Acidimicrobiales bacterium]|nr:class II glutamine amidotransferase [Acidimicrobiales bacterium]